MSVRRRGYYLKFPKLVLVQYDTLVVTFGTKLVQKYFTEKCVSLKLSFIKKKPKLPYSKYYLKSGEKSAKTGLCKYAKYLFKFC